MMMMMIFIFIIIIVVISIIINIIITIITIIIIIVIIVITIIILTVTSASVANTCAMKEPTVCVSGMVTWMNCVLLNWGPNRFLITSMETVAVALRLGKPPSLTNTRA